MACSNARPELARQLLHHVHVAEGGAKDHLVALVTRSRSTRSASGPRVRFPRKRSGSCRRIRPPASCALVMGVDQPPSPTGPTYAKPIFSGSALGPAAAGAGRGGRRGLFFLPQPIRAAATADRAASEQGTLVQIGHVFLQGMNNKPRAQNSACPAARWVGNFTCLRCRAPCPPRPPRRSWMLVRNLSVRPPGRRPGVPLPVLSFTGPVQTAKLPSFKPARALATRS